MCVCVGGGGGTNPHSWIPPSNFCTDGHNWDTSFLKKTVHTSSKSFFWQRGVCGIRPFIRKINSVCHYLYLIKRRNPHNSWNLAGNSMKIGKVMDIIKSWCFKKEKAWFLAKQKVSFKKRVYAHIPESHKCGIRPYVRKRQIPVQGDLRYMCVCVCVCVTGRCKN